MSQNLDIVRLQDFRGQYRITIPREMVQKLKWEKETLGMYVSSHPLSGLRKYIGKKAQLISHLKAADAGKRISLAGLEEVAAEGAVAEGCDAAGFGHCEVGSEEGLEHAGGDSTGDEENVCVAGGGDEVDAEAFDVIDRAVQADDLHLTPVAGARIDLSYGE
jgi:hypothetical protein